MNFKPKKFLSLLTASLLAAGGLVGVAAAPASAAPVAHTTFESGDTSGYTLGGSNDFGGVGSSVVALADQSAGVKTATGAAAGNIGKVSKPVGSADFWGGTTFSVLAGNEFISSVDKTVSMDIYTSAIVTVKLKLEHSGSVFVEQNVQSSGAGWQRVTFDFASPFAGVYAENNNYSTAAIFFNFNEAGSTGRPTVGGDYFFDNVTYTKQLTCVVSTASTLVSWDTADSSGAAPVTFGGALVSVKPAPSGSYLANNKALKITKPAGAEVWAGVTVLNNGCNNYAAATTITANVHASAAGTITVKLEGAADTEVQRSVVAGWQTVTWTIGAIATQRSKVSFFTDLMSAGSAKVFYLDDIAFNGATSPTIDGTGVQAPAVSYDVRLTSSLKNTATDTYEWTACGGQAWCLENNYFMKMIDAGASTTLTYIVTTHGTTTPVANATVRLRMNTNNSGSNATWSSGGNSFGVVSTSNGSDAGYISGTTNSSGEVSFTFANTNNTGEAARTLNNNNPYPAGCASPAGQTKGALQPSIEDVPGSNIDTQYVDVLWPHIVSSTIESSIAAGSDGVQPCPVPVRPGTKVWSPYFDQDKKGFYPHVRLEKSFLNEKLDGTWWDGVWQNRDADSRAYLKYLPVGSTFALTYHVTDEYGAPYVGAKVSLIVNANYSCAKTFFSYEGSLIGPDDCAGGGETELPAKTVGADGRVTFVLTNTNTTGEAMPVDLNGAPNPATKEVGTNIKPNVVGAKQQGIDMLFAHFVEPAGLSKATGPAAKTANIGTGQVSEFALTDDAGKPLSNTDVKYFVNGFDSKAGFARTDAAGKVRIHSTNSVGLEGVQTVGVSLIRDGKLPLAATATINWMAPELSIAAAGAAKSVVVKVAGAAGQTVQIKVAGKTFRRVAQSAITEFSIPSTAGKKSVSVKVGGKTLSRMVTVTK